MGQDKDRKGGSIEVKVELTGNYEDIADILAINGDKLDEFDDIFGDFESILTTIDRLEGGTRSRIASELPESTSIDIDGENIVDILRVLEQYDIVVLDQYTWRRAPTDGET